MWGVMVYMRKEVRWIEPADRRELWAAEQFARRSLGKPLDWLVSFHPRYLHRYPEIPLADLFKDGRRRTATRLQRRGIGFYGTWVRENYEGERREHLHIALYLPDADAAEDLVAGWRSWFPGDERIIRITKPDRIFDARKGEWMSRAVSYSAKQMLPAAAYHDDPKLRYHRESANHWGEPVAPVLGHKWGDRHHQLCGPHRMASSPPRRPLEPRPRPVSRSLRRTIVDPQTGEIVCR
jgi:hypothetical protein